MMQANGIRLALLATAAVAVAAPVQAGHGTNQVRLEQCLDAASSIRKGDFVKVEYLSVSPAGAPSYEIEVRDDADTEWELMCNARTGDIYEIETEVDSPDDAAFSEQAKISEETALDTALARYPGEVAEVEYELEANGDPTYEVDIRDDSGTEFKIEVDAVSGNIIEVSVESWEIGSEADERP